MIYEFSRIASQKAKITVPLLVDSLSYSLKNDQRIEHIIEVIGSHCHPATGAKLFEQKGIIYVNSIAEADELCKRINDKYPNLATAIHSNNSNVQNDIHAFRNKKQQEPGIVIAVQMLSTGYDDPALSWCFIARNNMENSTVIQQAAGRVLRYNVDYPNKVGYVITDSRLEKNIFECHKDPEALERAHQNYFIVNREQLYLEILRAIKSKHAFEPYRPLFANNKLDQPQLSLAKRLELLLVALKYKNESWQKNVVKLTQFLSTPYQLRIFSNSVRPLDMISLFLLKVKASASDPLLKELYSNTMLDQLLELIRQHNAALFGAVTSAKHLQCIKDQIDNLPDEICTAYLTVLDKFFSAHHSEQVVSPYQYAQYNS